MRSSIATKNKLTLLSQMGEESKFQVLQYNSLKGGENYKSILTIKEIESLGKRLKQVRVKLNDSSIKIQDNSLSYIKGNIIKSYSNNYYNKIKSIFSSRKSKEASSIKEVLKGTGEVLLEPSFQDFTLIELIDEEIIIDNKIFYSCDGEIEINFDNEEDKLNLSGSGVVVLKIPVPENEIIMCRLFNDELIVNNDIVILRNKNIKIESDKYDYEIGDKVVQKIIKKYSGMGEIWILPTRTIYYKYGKITCDDI